MAQQTINIGASANDGTGDSLRTAGQKINDNFSELYPKALSGTVTSVAMSGGSTGLSFSGSPITGAGTFTLSGTLAVANGGTGLTSLTSGYLPKGNGTSAFSASQIYDNGTNVAVGHSSPSAKFDVRNGNGTIALFSGGGSGYQGIATVNTYVSSSNFGATYWDSKNESSIAVGTLYCNMYTDGSSEWEWSLTAAGSRSSDRRSSGMKLGPTFLRPGQTNVFSLGTASFLWTTVYATTGTINTSDERHKNWLGGLSDAMIRAGQRIIKEIGLYQLLASIQEKGSDAARVHVGLRAQHAWAIMAEEGLAPPLVTDERGDLVPSPDWAGLPPPAWLCYDRWDAQPEQSIPETEVIEIDEPYVDYVPAGRARKDGSQRFKEVQKIRKVPVEQPTGRVIVLHPAIEAGDRFGLRTDELTLFLLACITSTSLTIGQ